MLFWSNLGEFTKELTKNAGRRGHSEVEYLWTLPTASKWKLRQDSYSMEQEMAIVEVYVAYVTRTIMSCQKYKIGGEFRLQRQGGPSGVRVTGSIAKNVMREWRR